ncbi:MAG: DUF3310 domain-containing protein [Leuconostoc mesenteroides]
MSEIIYVKVDNKDQFVAVVLNHGKEIEAIGGVLNDVIDFKNIAQDGSVVVELEPDDWVWCGEDYYKRELGSNFVPLSYEAYMKKYGHTELAEKPEEDMVNHPSHYTQFDRETIDTMKGMSTPEEFRGHLKLTAVKYISRYQGKNGIQDIEKAIWYMERLKKELIDERK